jgi:hypothetical protein
MLMVIFGAGASYGSRRMRPANELPPPRGDPRRPPLTSELLLERFGTFAARYPSSRPAIVALRRALSDDPNKPIETAIGELYERGNVERLTHLLALRFYLCDLVEEVTNDWWERFDGFTYYTELLDRIGTWRRATNEPVLLVTFNYDMLLDRTAEAQAATWKLSGFGSYIARPDWQLFKLHGSVGWSRALATEDVFPEGADVILQDANSVIAWSLGTDFDTGELCPQHWSRAVTGEDAVAVPGIAVPTTLKQSFQCPPEHVTKFTAEIGNVDRLLTIGWRAAETHVRELLDAHIPPGYHLGICDVSERDTIMIHENLGLAARRSPDVTPFTNGFEGLLAGDRLEEWLHLPRPGAH